MAAVGGAEMPSSSSFAVWTDTAAAVSKTASFALLDAYRLSGEIGVANGSSEGDPLWP